MKVVLIKRDFFGFPVNLELEKTVAVMYVTIEYMKLLEVCL